MKSSKMALHFSKLSRLAIFVFVLLQVSQPGFAQGGNSISGHVFGLDRLPLSDLHVELLDDLSRTVNRGRTNASGRYFFYGLPSGRFSVRVLPYGTDYEEQEQSVEIVNFRRSSGGGDDRLAGVTNEQRDFYLRPRKGAVPGVTAAVFAQDVPADARRFYEAAVVDLGNKKTVEAYAGLKSALEIFPTYFSALEMLGLEYVGAGHFDAARLLLKMAVDVNPRAYKSWHGLAVALNSLKLFDEALAAVQKSVEINPSISESLLLAGALLRQSKKYPEAEKALLKAKELANRSIADIHWELALLYGKDLKRFKDAARELKLYLKARPDDKNAESIKRLIVDFETKAKSS